MLPWEGAGPTGAPWRKGQTGPREKHSDVWGRGKSQRSKQKYRKKQRRKSCSG